MKERLDDFHQASKGQDAQPTKAFSYEPFSVRSIAEVIQGGLIGALPVGVGVTVFNAMLLITWDTPGVC